MRMFFNVIKKSYTLLRQNLVILQPLILFMLIMTITLSSLNNIQKGISPAIVVLAVCCFCMIGAFLAGWYPLFTKVIENSYNTSSTPQEKAYMSIQTLKEFLPGVGNYFLPILLTMILYVGIIFVLSQFISILGLKFIGLSENINPDKLINVLSNSQNLENFVKNLTPSDHSLLLKWDLLILAISSLFSYLTMFWLQAIIIKTKNPLKAFIENLKAIFAKPFITLGLFLFYLTTNMFVGLFSGISTNFIFQLLNLFIVIFLTAYFIMVNFVYFEDYNENTSPRRSNSFW